MGNVLSKINKLLVKNKEGCLYYEKERLASFEKWSNPFISKYLLSKMGFYYTKQRDVVKCYFCAVELGEWEKNDNVVFEHLKWSPNCKLLTGHKTNNIPINRKEFEELLPQVNFSYVKKRIVYPNSMVIKSENVKAITNSADLVYFCKNCNKPQIVKVDLDKSQRSYDEVD